MQVEIPEYTQRPVDRASAEMQAGPLSDSRRGTDFFSDSAQEPMNFAKYARRVVANGT